MWKLISLILISGFCFWDCYSTSRGEGLFCIEKYINCSSSLHNFTNSGRLLEYDLINQSTYQRYCALVATARTCINTNRVFNCLQYMARFSYYFDGFDPVYLCNVSTRTAINNLASTPCTRNETKKLQTLASMKTCRDSYINRLNILTSNFTANSTLETQIESCRLIPEYSSCPIQAATNGCGAQFGRLINNSVTHFYHQECTGYGTLRPV